MILLTLFILTIAQNASFTLVSRARNSGSIWYNAGASVLSNGIWYLVFRKIQQSPDDVPTAVIYISGTVIGSVLMQWVAIKYIEPKLKAKKESGGR